MVGIDGLRRYAAPGPSGDEVLLQLCLDAAIAWFEGSGVDTAAYADSPLYELGVYMLALHWYDQRGVMIASGSAGNKELPYGALTIMNQLRFGAR